MKARTAHLFGRHSKSRHGQVETYEPLHAQTRSARHISMSVRTTQDRNQLGW
jgi:hypothetical protein